MSEIISRNDFLKRLAVIPFGLPTAFRSSLRSARPEAGMCFLRGKVTEKESGRMVPAKVLIVDEAGRFYHPEPYIPHRDLRPDLQKVEEEFCRQSVSSVPAILNMSLFPEAPRRSASPGGWASATWHIPSGGIFSAWEFRSRTKSRGGKPK